MHSKPVLSFGCKTLFSMLLGNLHVNKKAYPIYHHYYFTFMQIILRIVLMIDNETYFYRKKDFFYLKIFIAAAQLVEYLHSS